MSTPNTNSEEDPPNLDELRVKIDALDSSLVSLLNQRAEVVVKIGKAKQHDGSPIYAPDRESSVLKKIIAESEHNENTNHKETIDIAMKSLNTHFNEVIAEKLVNLIKQFLNSGSLSNDDKKEYEDKLYLLQFNRIMRV